MGFMTQNHLVKDGQMTDQRGMFAGGGYSETSEKGGVGFGLGFSVFTDQVFSKRHDSVGTFGWGGAASTSFRCDPAKNMFYVFCTALRHRDDAVFPLRERIMQHVQACIDD